MYNLYNGILVYPTEPNKRDFDKVPHRRLIYKLEYYGIRGSTHNWIKFNMWLSGRTLQAVLLLWIIYVISVLFFYAFMHVCLLMPCGHLLGKG